jgi:hypothetical protein
MARIEIDGKKMSIDHVSMAGTPICVHAVGDGGCNLPKNITASLRRPDGSCKGDNCGACEMSCNRFVLKKGMKIVEANLKPQENQG